MGTQQAKLVLVTYPDLQMGGGQVNRGNAEGGDLRGAAAMMGGECVSLHFYIFIYLFHSILFLIWILSFVNSAEGDSR